MEEVLESTRREESTIKKQTKEQLDAFRRQQIEADRALKEVEGEVGADTISEEKLGWGKGGKRKRREGRGGLGIKRRESSTQEGVGTIRGEKAVGSVEKGGSKGDIDTKSDVAIAKKSEDQAAPKSVHKDQAVKEEKVEVSLQKAKQKDEAGATASTPKVKVGLNLGLGGYSSDEDD